MTSTKTETIYQTEVQNVARWGLGRTWKKEGRKPTKDDLIGSAVRYLILRGVELFFKTPRNAEENISPEFLATVRYMQHAKSIQKMLYRSGEGLDTAYNERDLDGPASTGVNDRVKFAIKGVGWVADRDGSRFGIPSFWLAKDTDDQYDEKEVTVELATGTLTTRISMPKDDDANIERIRVIVEPIDTQAPTTIIVQLATTMATQEHAEEAKTTRNITDAMVKEIVASGQYRLDQKHYVHETGVTAMIGSHAYTPGSVGSPGPGSLGASRVVFTGKDGQVVTRALIKYDLGAGEIYAVVEILGIVTVLPRKTGAKVTTSVGRKTDAIYVQREDTTIPVRVPDGPGSAGDWLRKHSWFTGLRLKLTGVTAFRDLNAGLSISHATNTINAIFKLCAALPLTVDVKYVLEKKERVKSVKLAKSPTALEIKSYLAEIMQDATYMVDGELFSVDSSTIFHGLLGRWWLGMTGTRSVPWHLYSSLKTAFIPPMFSQVHEFILYTSGEVFKKDFHDSVSFSAGVSETEKQRQRDLGHRAQQTSLFRVNPMFTKQCMYIDVLPYAVLSTEGYLAVYKDGMKYYIDYVLGAMYAWNVKYQNDEDLRVSVKNTWRDAEPLSRGADIWVSVRTPFANVHMRTGKDFVFAVSTNVRPSMAISLAKKGGLAVVPLSVWNR